jgi:hypothetical protein
MAIIANHSIYIKFLICVKYFADFLDSKMALC